jgi:hypothetical protein
MNERCYFGCDEPIRHTLLELPPPYSGAPHLCEFHSKSWRTYRALVNHSLEWPDDFWPWADKERRDMEKAPTQVSTETRAPDTEILASEAIPGFWYTVPSGEIERCYGQRSRGRGVQVGFVGITDSGSDPEEIRWLQGRTSILVADEIAVAGMMRSAREHGEGFPPDLAIKMCPRNGLVCSACHGAQFETPTGPICEASHGGAEGLRPIDVANRLGEDGHSEEARAILDSVPAGAREPPAQLDLDLQAGGPALTPEQAAQAYPEAYTGVKEALDQLTPEQLQRAKQALSDLVGHTNLRIVVGTENGPREVPLADNGLEQLTARTADRLVLDQDSASLSPRPSAGPSSVFHKSLHIDWRTPKDLFNAQVARWGPYWLDAAATAENRLCEYWLGPGSDVEDALSVDWEPVEEITERFGYNIWLNHPYSKGEGPCAESCAKEKCVERGYHLDRRIASSAEWMIYARNQAIAKALWLGGVLTCLTKRAGETDWWGQATRAMPAEVGAFISGRADPFGGPAAEFMNSTPYPAATWFEFRWEKLIIDITEIKGRVDFDRGGNDGSAGFPSVLITYYRPGGR